MLDNPIVVLSDNDTYESVNACKVLFLSKNGHQVLENGNSVKHLDREEDIIGEVSLEELIEFYLDYNPFYFTEKREV